MKNLLCTSLILSGFMLASCSNETENVTSIESGKSTLTVEVDASLPKVQNSFAWKYLSSVRNYAENKDASMAVSPLSMIYALGMTANGADGTTLTEITSALGYDGSVNALNYYCKQTMERMMVENDSAKVNIANCVEVNKNYNIDLKPDYKATVEDVYDALVESNDFKADGFADYLNTWCSNQTDGMIDDMFEEAPKTAYALIMNALCFRGIWHSKFDIDNTVAGSFSLSSGEKKEICFMNQTEQFGFKESSDYKILSMDYGDGAYSMQFILPQKGKTVSDAIEILSERDWNEVISELETTKVEVCIPRFTIDYKCEELIDVLKSLGIKSMFSSEYADFSKLSEIEGLYVSKVDQKVHVEVDEDGTRSAAVTVIEFDTTGGDFNPNYFYADRPFLFVLTEKATGTILFMGQYTGQE